MTYEKSDFYAMTGRQLNEVRAKYEAAGIAPAGWSKMTVAEKRSWLARWVSDYNLAVTILTPTGDA